ncbi:MAG: hypothetical protein H6585_07985 [Flavobacteriales bacterium]|nr:hypothetical protein [Flavobacteriales bacterium]MCB9448267.1 hypothetical protein [Flavobacteriales bacterium]
MRITEKFAAVLAILGTIMRLLHVPGGGMASVLGLTTLAILYFPLGILLLRNETIREFFKSVRERKSGAGVAFASSWVLATLTSGIMFKIMFWPGSGMMLSFGVAATGIGAGIGYFFLSNKYPEIVKRMLSRAIPLLVAGILLMTIPYEKLVYAFWPGENPYQQAYRDMLLHPDDLQRWQRLEAIRDSLDMLPMSTDSVHQP